MGSSKSKPKNENTIQARSSNPYIHNPNPNISYNNIEDVEDIDFRTRFPCQLDKNSLLNLMENLF